jgi:hypothetical protein
VPMLIARRNLTVHFQKSVKVTSTESIPQSVEVTVIPLQDASNAEAVATYVGGPQSATTTLLKEDNVVVFSLVPSYLPGLSNPINYRIMWRVGGVVGRTETYDFAMPDSDISFDQLQSVGNIIDGDSYLQQSDLGVAGRVARLNNDGMVIDAAGNRVAMPSEILAINNALTSAVEQLQQEAEAQRSTVYQTVDYRLSALNTTLSGKLQQAISGWDRNLKDEQETRALADKNFTQSVSLVSRSVTDAVDNFNTSFSALNTVIGKKADIDNSGYIPISQIPPAAITNWIPLQAASDRFGLVYPNDIQRGDVVLTPTGLFGLIGTNPASPSNWYVLNQVLSVQGKTGAITLTAAEVGALPSGVLIEQSQISGLISSLESKATKTFAQNLSDQITVIQNDNKIVRLNSSGKISHLLLDEYVAYVNALGQITTKSGTVISDPSDRGVLSVNGKFGTVTLTASDVGAFGVNTLISQAKIDGLSAALASKADLQDGKILIAQIPLIPQSKIDGLSGALLGKANIVNGAVPIEQLPLIPQNKINQLPEIISGNGLTATSNAISRVDSLERKIQGWESSGGLGTGGGSSAVDTSVYWGGTTDSDIAKEAFSTIVLSSPFGIYSSGSNAGKWYYNRNGVPSGDAAFPTITPAGHLKLYKWAESNPPDVVYALQSDLSTVSDSLIELGDTVGEKANTSDLNLQRDRIDTLYLRATNKADLDPSLKTLVPEQIPFSVKPNPKVVSSTTAMRALTTSQVHAGDVCIVTGEGTYTLLGNNPGSINNIDGWALHPGSSTVIGGGGVGTVVSISGLTQDKLFPDASGNITLQPSDIGAATSNSLLNYVTSSEYTLGLSEKVSSSEVYDAIGDSQLVRARVDYVVQQFSVNGKTYCQNGVATTLVNGVATPSGSVNSHIGIDRTPDGSQPQLINASQNSLILLTNQPSPTTNGIWKVSTTGLWTRPENYFTGKKVFAGTIVIVNNRIFNGAGTRVDGQGDSVGSSNYTIWQNTTNAVIGSTVSGVNAATTWRNLGTIAPIKITGGGGISVTGTYPNINISSDVLGGFVRKFTTTTTPSSSTFSVTHGLNTRFPQVTVIDDVTGNVVLVAWKVDPPNATTGTYDSVTFQFNNTSYSNSYRISIHG